MRARGGRKKLDNVKEVSSTSDKSGANVSGECFTSWVPWGSLLTGMKVEMGCHLGMDQVLWGRGR